VQADCVTTGIIPTTSFFTKNPRISIRWSYSAHVAMVPSRKSLQRVNS
jgi:hypothetical protein